MKLTTKTGEAYEITASNTLPTPPSAADLEIAKQAPKSPSPSPIAPRDQRPIEKEKAKKIATEEKKQETKERRMEESVVRKLLHQYHCQQRMKRLIHILNKQVLNILTL